MLIYDIDIRVFSQIFSQFGDVNVHASSIEIRVVSPNFLQDGASVNNLVRCQTEYSQQFRFLGSKFKVFLFSRLRICVGHHLTVVVEQEVGNLDDDPSQVYHLSSVEGRSGDCASGRYRAPYQR